jgi:uncharacterized membrane protein
MNETTQQSPDGQEPPRQRRRRTSLARLLIGPKTEESHHIGTRLRNYLLTGLIIVGPISITLYIVWWFVNLIDGWIKPLLPSLNEIQRHLPFELPIPVSALPDIPGVGLIVAIIGLMLIGALTANLFGRTLFGYGEMMLERMPIVRNLYSALKQIFETVLSKSGSSFKKVGLIEYPRKGIHSLVFISTETRGEIQTRHGSEQLISVFLPTTPNPTSGFLLFVPETDVRVLDMSVEEAAKLIISAGLVVPEHADALAGAADRIEAAAKHGREPGAEDEAAKHKDGAAAV